MAFWVGGGFGKARLDCVSRHVVSCTITFIQPPPPKGWGFTFFLFLSFHLHAELAKLIHSPQGPPLYGNHAQVSGERRALWDDLNRGLRFEKKRVFSLQMIQLGGFFFSLVTIHDDF